MNLKELTTYLKNPDKLKYVVLSGNDEMKEYNIDINNNLVNNSKVKVNAAPYLNSGNNTLKVKMNYKKDDGSTRRQNKMLEVAGVFPEDSDSYLLVEQTPEQFADLEYPLWDISIIETPIGLSGDSVYVSLVNRMYKNSLVSEFINRKCARDFDVSYKEEGVIFMTGPMKTGEYPKETVKFLADRLGIKGTFPFMSSLGYYKVFDFKKETELVGCMLRMKEGAKFVGENFPGAVVLIGLPKYNGQTIDGIPFYIKSEIKKYPDEKVIWEIRKDKGVEILEMKLALGKSRYENMVEKLFEIYGLEFSNL